MRGSTGNVHGAGGFPLQQIPSSVALGPPPAPPGPHLEEEDGSAPRCRTFPFFLRPQRPSPPPKWVFPPFPQWSPVPAGDDPAPQTSPRTPTIPAQVPDTQGLVPRGRHKDEASVGSEAQISDHVLVPQEAEEEVPCGEEPCWAPSPHRGSRQGNRGSIRGRTETGSPPKGE